MVGKWFTFWAVGIRLALAGFMQITKPQYTVKEILNIQSPEANVLARELGFANLIFGIMGILSLFDPDWLTPAAFAGGLYYLMAGVGHLGKKQRNSKEQLATYSDLYIGILLVGFLLMQIFG